MRNFIAMMLLVMSTWSVAAEPTRSQARIALPLPPSIKPQEGPLTNLETICGKTDDSQEVERYQKRPGGPTKEFVAFHEPSTAQIRWIENLNSLFTAPDDPGDVQGVRWCTGTLIEKDLLLTAAHCFAIDPEGWRTPSRAGKKLQPSELATHMEVVFNFQLDGVSMKERPGVRYRVNNLVEYGYSKNAENGKALDYAILRLDPDDQNNLPGSSYRVAKFNSSLEARNQASQLTIIQHPAGKPKRIDAGEEIVEPRDVFIRYANLDSLGGSSGSGVLDQNGDIIGIHTNGGCTEWGGFNYGVSLHAISKVSAIIK